MSSAQYTWAVESSPTLCTSVTTRECQYNAQGYTFLREGLGVFFFLNQYFKECYRIVSAKAQQ